MRHQSTAGHLQAMVLSKTFGETRVDLQLSEQVCRETELHNEKMKKNREILKRLIDCVIFWASRNFHFGDTMKALDPKTKETMWSFFLFFH